MSDKKLVKQYNLFTNEVELVDEDGKVLRFTCSVCGSPMEEEKDCCSWECADWWIKNYIP